jgi:hypothetical protein
MDCLRGRGSGAGNDESGTCQANQEPSHLLSDQGTRRVKRDIRRFDIRRVEMRLHYLRQFLLSLVQRGYHAGGLDQYARLFSIRHTRAGATDKTHRFKLPEARF